MAVRKRAPESRSQRLAIKIQFRGFITRFEIDEIIAAIDSMIELEIRDWEPGAVAGSPQEELRHYDLQELLLNADPDPRRPQLSFVGIRSVGSGSIDLNASCTQAWFYTSFTALHGA